jgi:hypothetical protein
MTFGGEKVKTRGRRSKLRTGRKKVLVAKSGFEI